MAYLIKTIVPNGFDFIKNQDGSIRKFPTCIEAIQFSNEHSDKAKLEAITSECGGYYRKVNTLHHFAANGVFGEIPNLLSMGGLVR